MTAATTTEQQIAISNDDSECEGRRVSWASRKPVSQGTKINGEIASRMRSNADVAGKIKWALTKTGGMEVELAALAVLAGRNAAVPGIATIEAQKSECQDIDAAMSTLCRTAAHRMPAGIAKFVSKI